MLEWIETFLENIESLKDGIKVFINNTTITFTNYLDIFPREMKSILSISITLIVALMFYNFIWGHK